LLAQVNQQVVKIELKKIYANPLRIKVNGEYIFPYSVDTEFEIKEGK